MLTLPSSTNEKLFSVGISQSIWRHHSLTMKQWSKLYWLFFTLANTRATVRGSAPAYKTVYSRHCHNGWGQPNLILGHRVWWVLDEWRQGPPETAPHTCHSVCFPENTSYVAPNYTWSYFVMTSRAVRSSPWRRQVCTTLPDIPSNARQVKYKFESV